MEDLEQIPEEKNSDEVSNDSKRVEFENFLEKASKQDIINIEDKVTNKNNKLLNKDESLLKKLIDNGFDGITNNPNYKLLALLIILLINLSVFLLIGNLGKAFLRNAGILN